MASPTAGAGTAAATEPDTVEPKPGTKPLTLPTGEVMGTWPETLRTTRTHFEGKAQILLRRGKFDVALINFLVYNPAVEDATVTFETFCDPGQAVNGKVDVRMDINGTRTQTISMKNDMQFLRMTIDTMLETWAVPGTLLRGEDRQCAFAIDVAAVRAGWADITSPKK